MRQLLLCAGLLLGGCALAAHRPGPAPDREHREVVALAEAVFGAMRTRDTTALRQLFHPEARIAAVGEGGQLRTRSVAEFVASVAQSPEELRERMWSPRVEVSGELATLWAPYDFHRGESFSHCGHDAFHLRRTGGGWQIVALTYTTRRSGCEPPGRRG